MRKRSNIRGFLSDEGAQALTEFAIVIPVVLLAFFALFQYLIVAQTSQLVNYAAYAAARTYVVRHSVSVGGDHGAREAATLAAAMALAPVGRRMPGEPLPDLGLGSTGTKVGKLFAGFLTAGERLKPAFGGSVKITTSGPAHRRQANVEINYPQPLFVPGLIELWSLIPGDRGLHRSTKPLREGLTGIVASTEASAEFREGVEEVRARSSGSFRPVTVMPYVNVRGICSMGLENWGRRKSFRPRLPNTVEADETIDRDLEREASTQRQNDESELKAGRQRAEDRCREHEQAKQTLTAALNRVNATAPGTPERSLAEGELATARKTEQTAGMQCEAAKRELQGAAEDLERQSGEDP